MKSARATLIAGVIAGVCTAANAFFFFIPTGAIINAVQGAHCVPATAKPGDKINVGGKMWTLVENNGPSSRCSQTPNFPNIAKMEPYYTEAERAATLDACLPYGAYQGQRVNMPIVGQVEVVAITNDNCSDVRAPISVKVVRFNSSEPSQPVKQPVKAAEPAPAPAPVQASAPSPEVSSIPPERFACVPMFTAVNTRIGDKEVVQVFGQGNRCLSPYNPVMAEVRPFKEPPPPAVAKSTADRLRELKQLREESLITQEVYEEKQRDILKDQ